MNTSLSSLTQPIAHFFERHHPTIFFSIIGILLSAAILMLFMSSTIDDSDPSLVKNQAISNSYDKDTAEKIKNLHQRTDNLEEIQLPTSRQSPFVE